MWYTQFATSRITDRTRAGNSVDESFLKIRLDALTHREPARFIFGVGNMYGRVMSYTDGAHDREKISARDGLQQCLEHFDTIRVAEMEAHEMPQFHNTLVWSQFFLSLITTNQLLAQHGHELMVVHMMGSDREYNRDHPMIRCTLPEVEAMPRYLPVTDNCSRVCREAGIRPWDHDLYGWLGHHSHMGQQRWRRRIQERGIAWN